MEAMAAEVGGDAAAPTAAATQEAPVRAVASSPAWARELAQAVAASAAATAQGVALLDWGSGLDLAAAVPGATVFAPPDPAAGTLPHLDASVDVVACRDGATLVAEAARVARVAVIVAAGEGTVRVERRATSHEAAAR